MSKTESLPRLLSISQIRESYVTDMSYKKTKAWLLKYIPFKKVGNTYYFSKKKLEEFIEAAVDYICELDQYS